MKFIFPLDRNMDAVFIFDFTESKTSRCQSEYYYI